MLKEILSAERLSVVKNIEAALAEGNTFAKVELGDPTVTDEDVRRVILPFDNLRRSPPSRLKARIARALAERFIFATLRRSALRTELSVGSVSSLRTIQEYFSLPTETPILRQVRLAALFLANRSFIK